MRMDAWQGIGVPIIYTALSGVLGLLAGALLNVFIDSVPEGRRPSAPYRYRCHHCRHGRFVIVELLCGVMLGALYLVFGLTPEFGVAAFWGLLFTAISVIDLERGLIPNRIVYPSLAAALLLAGLVRDLPWLGGLGPTLDWPQIAIAGLGGGLGFLLLFMVGLLVVLLLGKEGLGWGDVKLAAVIGLAVGFPLIVPAMVVAAAIGSAAALAARRWAKHETVPFGPALAAGAMTVIVGGKGILQWMAGF